MKLTTILTAATVILSPSLASATMDTRLVLGCVVIPVADSNVWQRMDEGCALALPSTKGGGIIAISPRPQPRPPGLVPVDPPAPEPEKPVEPPKPDPKPDPKPEPEPQPEPEPGCNHKVAK